MIPAAQLFMSFFYVHVVENKAVFKEHIKTILIDILHILRLCLIPSYYQQLFFFGLNY